MKTLVSQATASSVGCQRNEEIDASWLARAAEQLRCLSVEFAADSIESSERKHIPPGKAPASWDVEAYRASHFTSATQAM